MTLKEAIEILNDCTKGALLGISEDTKDAIKLGIEATCRLMDGRAKGYDYFGHLLQGETED